MYATMNDAFNHYSALFEGREPVWNQEQLRAWLDENVGRQPQNITDEDIKKAYESSLLDSEGVAW